MTYYLGVAGAFAALPDPEVGLPLTPERIGGTHQLLSGNRVRDTLGRMRTWNLSWSTIDLTTYGLLESFYYSSEGPFYFFDAQQRNLLPQAVSSATDSTLFVTGPHAVLSNASTAGTFSGIGGPWPIWSVIDLAVTVPTTVAANETLLKTPSIPVLIGTTYTGSVYIGNHTTTVGVVARFNWLDASKTWFATSTGSTVAAGATGRSVVTAAAPANTFYAQIELMATAANTSGSPQSLDVDGLMIEVSGTASAWAPGTGVPLVTVESLTPSTPLLGIVDAQMTLVQVG